MADNPRHYLETMGWRRSMQARLPIDGSGEPLPWYSYAAIHFLENRLPEGLDVFEFGSGCSTLWWAQRCKSLHAVEHDPSWFAKMSPTMPDNAQLRHVELDLDGEYARAIAQPGHSFDVVIVDGRDRVHCGLQALSWVKPDGVVIWDDSERPRYEPGYRALSDAGFRRIDFIGLGPVTANRQATSIFYRNANCFGL